MPHLEQITTTPTLTFDALTAGRPDAPLVLLLHGFAESMQCWRTQVAALGAAGYRIQFLTRGINRMFRTSSLGAMCRLCRQACAQAQLRAWPDWRLTG